MVKNKARSKNDSLITSRSFW